MPLEPPYTDPYARQNGTAAQSDPFAKANPPVVSGDGVVASAPIAITPEGTHNAQFLEFDATSFDVQEQGNLLKISNAAPAGAGQGNLPVDMTAGDAIISDADARAYGCFTATGAMAAQHSITVNAPASDADSFMRLFRNQTTGGFNVVFTVGATTIAVSPGGSLLLYIEPTGVSEAVTVV